MKITITRGNDEKQPSWYDGKYTRRHWNVRLEHEGRSMTTDFWTGRGHMFPPASEEVLCCLAQDAFYGAMTFPEYLDEFSSVSSVLEAKESYRSWQGCQKIRDGLASVLGADYDRFVEEWRSYNV